MEVHLTSTASSRAQRGFTLLELMVTIAILAILLAIGVPSFTAYIESSRATATANELLYYTQLTRSEAVKRNSAVTLCPTADQETCATDSVWTQGWLVIAGSEVIRVQSAIPGNMTLTLNPTLTQITLTAVGTTANATDFSLTIGAQTRCISLLTSGKADVSQGDCPP